MKKDYRESITQYIRMEREVLDKLDIEELNLVINRLEEARLDGARIYICGNGGSASTASHFAGDFNKGVNEARGHLKKYNLISLSDNIPSMMAVANDHGYGQIFIRPIENAVSERDVFIGISGSGNSENVILAAQYAKESGADIISLTGYDGGRLRELADLKLHVPIHNMQITEDVHLVFEHLMMWVLAYA